MDKYRQQQHKWDSGRRNPVHEGRRARIRKENETTESNNNINNGTKPISTSSSLPKQPQPHRGEGRSRGRSPRPGFDPQTDDKLYKTSVRGPSLPPRGPVNEKKVVNWRLACYMSNEYLTRGTLLGRAWPPQDLNPNCRHENNYKSMPKPTSLDKDDDEIRREKEGLYHTLTDFLREGEVHLPGIVNPSQLASWLGCNQ